MATTFAIDPDIRQSLNLFAQRIREAYPVKEILLYGSRARGDHRPDSDVDVAVVLAGPKRRKMDVTLEMGALAADFLLEDGLFLTPFPIWEDEWAEPSLANNRWLIEAIKAEGIAL